METEIELLRELALQVPAVLLFWFVFVRPHLKKIEGGFDKNNELQRKTLEAVGTMTKSIDTLSDRVSGLDARVRDLEEWRDKTPTLGIRTEK